MRHAEFNWEVDGHIHSINQAHGFRLSPYRDFIVYILVRVEMEIDDGHELRYLSLSRIRMEKRMSHCEGRAQIINLLPGLRYLISNGRILPDPFPRATLPYDVIYSCQDL